MNKSTPQISLHLLPLKAGANVQLIPNPKQIKIK